MHSPFSIETRLLTRCTRYPGIEVQLYGEVPTLLNCDEPALVYFVKHEQNQTRKTPNPKDTSVQPLPANIRAATTADQHTQCLGYLQDELNRQIWPPTTKTKTPSRHTLDARALQTRVLIDGRLQSCLYGALVSHGNPGRRPSLRNDKPAPSYLESDKGFIGGGCKRRRGIRWETAMEQVNSPCTHPLHSEDSLRR